MSRALVTTAAEALQRAYIFFFRPPTSPSLCLSSIQNYPLNHGFEYYGYNNYEDNRAPDNYNDETTTSKEEYNEIENSIWNFAVPKSKITRSKKRMKTTVQKRIKLKKNIVIDERTGELTLKHKLPFNWKDYLPKYE